MNDPKVYHEQVCPRCGKDDVFEGSTVEVNGDVAWQQVTCNCGYRYVEVYKYYCTEVYADDNDSLDEEEA